MRTSVCVVVENSDAALVSRVFEKWLVLSSVARSVTTPTIKRHEGVMEALKYIEQSGCESFV